MEQKHENFIGQLNSLAEDFLKISLDVKIRIVGHLDTDGICSVALLQKALERKNYSCETIFYQQLEDSSLDELKEFNDELIFFVDIGANYESQIKSFLQGKKIIILDHHASSQEQIFNVGSIIDDDSYFVQINPQLSSITNNQAISGAGVVYYFALGLDEKNKDLSYLGILGALGDAQERGGLQEFNKYILDDSIELGILEQSSQLNLFGTHSRSLVKVLEYSTDMNIPGVTGNFKGVISLLEDLGIDTYRNGKSRKYIDLVKSEKESLENALVKLVGNKGDRQGSSDSVLYKTVYSFKDKNKWSVPDLKEFATMINSCGRLNAYNVALSSVLGNKESLIEAKKLLNDYKLKLRTAFSSFKKRKESGDVYDSGNLLIVHFKNDLDFSIAGVIASMIARNKIYSSGKIICVLSEQNEQTKVSLRVSRDAKGTNLRDLLAPIAQKLGVSTGGHENAAGMIFSSEKVDLFLDLLKNS